jgi:hypothetical protein
MMQGIHKKMGFIGLALIAAISAGTAHAGDVYRPQVSIISNGSSGGYTVYGTLAGARFSSDARQRLGCYYSNATAGCYATNSAGLSVYCTVSDARMREIITSLSATSYIILSVDRAGFCSSLEVNNGSSQL